MISLVQKISEELMVSERWLMDALENADIKYKKIVIKKKNGGKRTLLQPSAEVKQIQHWLLNRVFSKLPVSPIATAFEKGASIRKNAEIHCHSKFSVRVDVRNFFPSIRFEDLCQVLSKHQDELFEFGSGDSINYVIRKSCFDSFGRLPVGYPSSPKIANLVMFSLDQQLQRVISDHENFGRAVVTRYADDYIFSTDKPGSSRYFVKSLELLFKQNKHPELKINDAKTRMMSRAGGSTLVTGLRVKSSGQVGIHAHYRSHIRLLLKLMEKNSLRTEDRQKLKGHLAFIQNADPYLFTKLQTKHFRQIHKLFMPDAESIITSQ